MPSEQECVEHLGAEITELCSYIMAMEKGFVGAGHARDRGVLPMIPPCRKKVSPQKGVISSLITF